MRASVIVRTKDEADRLRLTLASLAVQTEPAEVVVVNDGSSDHTEAVIEAWLGRLDLVRVAHVVPRGRSAAANAGAAYASGELLIFLDGDSLAGRDLVSHHLSVHRLKPWLVARGETFHLRCTRLLADPESGSPMPDAIEKVGRLTRSELARMCVTLAEVTGDFAAIERRAQPGIYPGAGPRLLYELEMQALQHHPACNVLWVAASGSNQSVRADAFRSVGGFDAGLAINEHRELALRLCRLGMQMVPASGARTYHLTHRSGWRDPLEDTGWERRFYAAHPIPEVALLSLLWASLSETTPCPPEARILSLPQLEAAAARCAGLTGIEAIRRAHLATAGASGDMPGQLAASFEKEAG